MIEILAGDCRETLKNLADQSINTCITSPPYWGLRDYGQDEQLGLEDTPEEYVANLVQVFGEVKRVLRDDGTVWLNLGDSYAGSGKGPSTSLNSEHHNLERIHSKIVPDNLKSKDLVGIPWRVAFALQQDGWYLRQDIIWHKPNPMPESVTDRCTKAHEYIFLLSKQAKYYFDYEAISEDSVYAPGKTHEVEREKGYYKGKWSNPEKGSRNDGSFKAIREKRNKRSVWRVPAKPFKGAHFATFPMDLIEPCVLAGCPEGGTVLDPFGGSGTTGQIADGHNRNAILCELNPEYIEISKKRLGVGTDLFSEVEVKNERK
jgi:DNA modification methylase